jgi:hypothetical protein
MSSEVAGLNVVRLDTENLHGKVETLNKELEGAKAAEALAIERVLKTIDIADNLRKEIDSERESSTALKAQVHPLNKHLEATKEAGLSVMKMRQYLRLTRRTYDLQSFFLVQGSFGEASCICQWCYRFWSLGWCYQLCQDAGSRGMPSYRKCARGTPWGPL